MSKIIDSMDVTPYESPILIIDNGNVYYHPENNWKYPGDDGVWMIGQQEEWQRDFDELEPEKVDALKRYSGEWDGKASASNIHSYVTYYGHSRQGHSQDWKWADFSSAILGLSDEHCYSSRAEYEDEDDDDDAIVCDSCNKGITEGDEITIPETREYLEQQVCNECFDGEPCREHLEQLEEERGSL